MTKIWRRGSERHASNQKVAKRWFDSRCGSASLCPWGKTLNAICYLGAKQSTRFGGPA